MSKICQLTGKKPLSGNNISHAHNKSKMRQLPNLKEKKIWIPEENRFIKLKLSTRAIRTLKKKGYNAMISDLNK